MDDGSSRPECFNATEDLFGELPVLGVLDASAHKEAYKEPPCARSRLGRPILHRPGGGLPALRGSFLSGLSRWDNKLVTAQPSLALSLSRVALSPPLGQCRQSAFIIIRKKIRTGHAKGGPARGLGGEGAARGAHGRGATGRGDRAARAATKRPNARLGACRSAAKHP